jgi:hypothetical protein
MTGPWKYCVRELGMTRGYADKAAEYGEQVSSAVRERRGREEQSAWAV